MGNALRVTAVAGQLGATVTDIDLRAPLGARERAALGQALAEYLVLFFPDQHLDDEAHLRFATAFGGPYIHPIGRTAGRTTAQVEHIVDSPDRPPYQDRWHTDVSWDPEPPTYGTLRAIEVPERGGDTVWVSMYAVLEGLSPTLQQVLAPLRAHHDAGSGAAFASKAGDDLSARTRAAFPGAEHPVVAVHPDTGRRYLYVNREFTADIVGMRDEESEALLALLFTRVESPNVALRHRWSAGEVALWDERCTQHFAVADFLPARREMARVAVRSRPGRDAGGAG